MSLHSFLWAFQLEKKKKKPGSPFEGLLGMDHGIEKLEEIVWGPKEHPQVNRDHFSTES